jgi:hypothetical protein
MAFGVIRAKLFLLIISEHMNLNFKQTKVVCLKINSAEILSFFIILFIFMLYSKIIEKIILL